MKIKGKILILGLLFTMLSCNQWQNDYEITEDYLYSKFKLNDGFKISELKVSSLSTSNIPEDYKKVVTCYVGLNKYFEKYSRKKSPSIPSNKIFFNKKNESYKWSKYKYNGYYNEAKGSYEVMPMELKEKTWYYIEFTRDRNVIFFIINEKGGIRMHVKKPPFSIV